ncbi:MAG: hypothetical protein QXJ06_00815 [Candidatus Aenigmatarchaeota archaeon]
MKSLNSTTQKDRKLPELFLDNIDKKGLIYLQGFGFAKDNKIDIFYAKYICENDQIKKNLDNKTIEIINSFISEHSNILMEEEIQKYYSVFNYLLNTGRLSKFDNQKKLLYVLRKGRHFEDEPVQYIMKIIDNQTSFNEIETTINLAKQLRKDLNLIKIDLSENNIEREFKGLKFFSIKETIFD